ncbi:hypothetical protein ABIC03_007182 [Bradyrhizobium sp. RT6a]|uniref:DUF1353 domain-containing protein n=1 Tax=Bradyrhizobium sp. RT6a TaxID=3156381 RepID=UPI0033953963
MTMNRRGLGVWLKGIVHPAFLVLIGLVVFAPRPTSAEDFGAFKGDFIFRWLIDGRKMELTSALVYTDPKGTTWEVPSGAITDGASVPRVFWTYADPFVGEHRNAAVIHDHYCETKSRSWTATHLMFYQAMRAAGVPEVRAKVLYSAVYYFGPRWGIGTASKGPGATQSLTTEQERAVLNGVEEWIAASDPTIPDLNKRLDTLSPAIAR